MRAEAHLAIEIYDLKANLFFLLYRDLKVLNLTSKEVKKLSFRQKIKFIQLNYEVNKVEVYDINEKTIDLIIYYEGALNGYKVIFSICEG